MNRYNFDNQVKPLMERSFEKVNHHLKTLKADPAQLTAVLDIWYSLLKDCSHDDCVRAIEFTMREENQPRTVEGYIRRIRIHAKELERSRTSGQQSFSMPEADYLRDITERAQAWRQSVVLPPLAEPYKICTRDRMLEIIRESESKGIGIKGIGNFLNRR